MVAARSKDWVTRNELISVGLLREHRQVRGHFDGVGLRSIYTIIYQEPSSLRLGFTPYQIFTRFSPPFDAVELEQVAPDGKALVLNGHFWSKSESTQLNALASHTSKREGIRAVRSKMYSERGSLLWPSWFFRPSLCIERVTLNFNDTDTQHLGCPYSPTR